MNQAFAEYGGQVAEAQRKEAAVADQVYAFTADLLKSASAEEQPAILKAAETHKYNLDHLDHPQLKFAYMGGAMDAAAMQQTGGQDPAAGGAIGAGATIPGAEDGEASVEQIIAVITQAAEDGKIPQDIAMQAIQDLQAQSGGGDPTGGAMPPGGDPTGGAGADPAAPAEAKAASALLATLTTPAPTK